MSNLKKIRTEKDLTQEDLSVISGVSQQYISEIENGNRIGSIKTHVKLAKALGVTVDQIIASREVS